MVWSRAWSSSHCRREVVCGSPWRDDRGCPARAQTSECGHRGSVVAAGCCVHARGIASCGWGPRPRRSRFAARPGCRRHDAHVTPSRGRVPRCRDVAPDCGLGFEPRDRVRSSVDGRPPDSARTAGVGAVGCCGAGRVRRAGRVRAERAAGRSHGGCRFAGSVSGAGEVSRARVVRRGHRARPPGSGNGRQRGLRTVRGGYRRTRSACSRLGRGASAAWCPAADRRRGRGAAGGIRRHGADPRGRHRRDRADDRRGKRAGGTGRGGGDGVRLPGNRGRAAVAVVGRALRSRGGPRGDVADCRCAPGCGHPRGRRRVAGGLVGRLAGRGRVRHRSPTDASPAVAGDRGRVGARGRRGCRTGAGAEPRLAATCLVHGCVRCRPGGRPRSGHRPAGRRGRGRCRHRARRHRRLPRAAGHRQDSAGAAQSPPRRPHRRSASAGRRTFSRRRRSGRRSVSAMGVARSGTHRRRSRLAFAAPAGGTAAAMAAAHARRPRAALRHPQRRRRDGDQQLVCRVASEHARRKGAADR